MRGIVARIAVPAALVVLAAAGWCQQVKVFGADYFADTPFPQFMDLWHEGFALTQGQDLPPWQDAPGGYVFAHFQNTGRRPVKVRDLAVEGVKLSEGLGKTNDASGDLHGHSLAVSKLPPPEIAKLKSAGEPMWWKAEPRTVPAGGIGQIVIRLRKKPRTEPVHIEIVTDSGTARASVSTTKVNPRFDGIFFTPELDTVYLYLRHPAGGVKPDRVFMDGRNVTQSARIGADRGVDVVPIVVKLPKPLDPMSYHCFRVGYADGSAATAGVRAWGNELVYGIWGSKGDARSAYRDWAAHNFNVHMGHGDKATMELSLDTEGFAFLRSLGFRNMATWFGNARNPMFYFLLDEPDAHDYDIDDVPVSDRLGLLGQALVERLEQLRAKDPRTPVLLNVDNTYKPENWYVYHQLADIPCIDPYYQGELDLTYLKRPGRFSAFTKPTYVFAAASISHSACRPKPLHVILCSTRYAAPDGTPGYKGRFPTPEEKRLEVYYAISAGAKGISYWWFTPSGDCSGMGADVPEARALYREVGLLGAEVRTAGPIITTSCPIDLKLSGSRLLWLRALASGLDTVAIIAVNDNVLCDRLGTIYKPVEKAKVSVALPAWLEPKDVFEVTYRGIVDVPWKLEGSRLDLDMGRVDLSRFVLVTSDSSLRGKLKSLYETKFAKNVEALAGPNGR